MTQQDHESHDALFDEMLDLLRMSASILLALPQIGAIKRCTDRVVDVIAKAEGRAA